MKISDILKTKDITFSYEVFPPKMQSNFNKTIDVVNKLSVSKPDFISVTYGAGGGVSEYTSKIASHIENNLNLPALAHLTCVSSDKLTISNLISDFKAKNIQNILALRGDKPENFVESADYKYAYQLVRDIKSMGDFCVGGACYPEGHTECLHKEDDILNLKTKVDAGLDFLTTQMFFDNNILYHYMYRLLKHNINIPVIAGIMPVTNAKQISKIVKLSGTYLPARFKAIVDKFADDENAMKQAGIAYATEQIIDLIAQGVTSFHLYTMNKPDIAESIKNNLSYILR